MVQEAADIVASASDEEVNMIFGSVINDDLEDQIVVTVIATGFNEEILTQRQPRMAGGGMKRPAATPAPQAAPQRETRYEEEPVQERPQQPSFKEEEALDIPTFLRNRNRR